jgi:arsenate reductase
MEGEKKQTLKILFVCVGNAARSQMAEGFLRTLGGDHFQVSSAGVMPHWRVDSQAVEVMKEVGVNISDQRPKGLDEVDVMGQDLVITLCAASDDICPSAFSGEVRHWNLEDPHDRSLEVYHAVRDRIRELVEGLVEES